MNTNIRPFNLPGYVVYNEPELLFSATDRKARHAHPLLGLTTNGPYSASQLATVSNPIRVAFVAPHGMLPSLDHLINELQGAHSPKERPDYLIDYPGFASVFKVGITPSVDSAKIELPVDLGTLIESSKLPRQVLAEAVTKTLFVLKNIRHEFDIVLVLIPFRWKEICEKGAKDDFDLHDFIKATSASLYMPIQIVNSGRASSALEYSCRCSVMWRLSIAMYCKAGGIPWTLADYDQDTAYVGISYSLLGDKSHADRYAICCSQVFNADGAGLEFVAYEAENVRVYGKNPFLSRSQMLNVMSRSLKIYQHQCEGRKPKRVIVHKNTEFQKDEILGCFDALGTCDTVELIHVQSSTPWRGIRVLGNKAIDMFPCHRGTSLQIDENISLLWTHGNSTKLSASGRQYYKGGKGIPSPLLLVRYAGHGSMDEICRSTLALSKMNWNNDGPYDIEPVTISYAHTLAKVVKRIQKLEARPYPFRFFM